MFGHVSYKEGIEIVAATKNVALAVQGLQEREANTRTIIETLRNRLNTQAGTINHLMARIEALERERANGR